MLFKTHKTAIFPFYHSISESNTLTNSLYENPSLTKFKIDMRFYLKYYNSFPLSKIINYNKENKNLPNDIFHLSFDDGFSDNYEIALGFLKKEKIDATFFIVKDFLDNNDMFFRNKASLLINHIHMIDKRNINKIVIDFLESKNLFYESISNSLLKIKYQDKLILDEIGKFYDFSFSEYLETKKPYMTSSQIQELLGAGFSIGAHSIDHPKLQELDFKDQINQAKESTNFICKKFNLGYKAFAAPFNDIGLKKSYIQKLFSEKHIDIFFGTQGLRDDEMSNCFQRLSMDGGDSFLNPKNICKKSLSSALISRFLNKNKVIRTT